MATIAITGHTAGIGKAFSERLISDGHTIVGLSKREGNNIRNIPRIIEKIIPCDMWINNAQAGYSQTELLFKVCDLWVNQGPKLIWSIGTIMSRNQILPDISGLKSVEVAEYRNQKRSLIDAIETMRILTPNVRHWLIHPGAVATQPQWPNGANVNEWVDLVVDTWNQSIKHNLHMREFSADYYTGVNILGS